MKKILTLGLLLGLASVAGITAAESVKTHQQYNEVSSQEDISTYSQPAPSNVDYFIYYQLPQNSNQLTTTVNIDGLSGTNDSYNRTFKLELIEYSGSTSSTHLITTFTTPISGSQYQVTNTTTFTFDFVNFSYKLSLSVQDDTTSAWTEVSYTQVTYTQNLYAPTVVDSYFVTQGPTTELGSDGSIRFYYVVNNPSDANYNIAVTLKDSNGVVVDTQNFTNTTATTSGYVEFDGLLSDNYQVTATSSTVNGLSSGITYVNVLPDLHIPSAYFNASAVNAAAPGLNGQINTCGGVTDANGSSNVVVETSIDNGTTWTETCTVYNVAPGTYTVKGQVKYTSPIDSQTHYSSWCSKTVVVGTGAYTAPEATVTLNSTNASSPTAADGTIGGTVQWTKNYYNNASIEISLDETNWVDLSTGITGLTRGTYTVYYRIRWNDGVNSQDQYVTNNTPKTVNVGFDAWNAPDISVSASTQNTSTPTAVDGSAYGDTIINSDPSNGEMQMVEYVSVTTNSTTPSWTQDTGSITLNNLAVGTTVYVTGRVDYDHDYDSNTTMLTTTTQTYSYVIGNQAWTMPTFSTVANGISSGSADTGQIETTVTLETGDLEALGSMSLVLKNSTGQVVNTHVLTAADFTLNATTQKYEATYMFPNVLPKGAYTVEMSYNYNLVDGNGLTTYPTTVQIPVAISALDRPTATVNNLSVTNETTEVADDGSVNFSATLADPDSVIIASGIEIQLMKYTYDSGTDTYSWQPEGTAVTIANTVGTSHNVSYTSNTLDAGTYKFDFKITADPDGAGGPITPIPYVWKSNYRFTVGRDWSEPMSVATSEARVTDHVMDPTSTLETFSIVYDLTLNNPDLLPYTVRVDLVNLNSLTGTTPEADDVVVQSLTLSQATTKVQFDNVAPGNYELRLTQTSGTTIGSLPTSVSISSTETDNSFANPYLEIPADQNLEVNTYTSGGITYGELTATLFVQNPDNRNYQFDFLVYDLTTNTDVIYDTYTNNHDANNGAEIHYSYANGLDTSHTYAVTITNVSGVWIDGVNTNYVLVTPADFAAAMSVNEPTNVSAGKIAAYSSLVAVIALALIATPTYIVIRRRVK